MKKLYVLTSVPGSGKSTWALNFKANNLNTFIVSSDEIRKELGGSYQYFKEEDRVWKIFYARANKYARENESCNVILDSTAMNDYYRELYIRKCKGFDKYILVYFDTPFSIARKRNENRMKDKQVPTAIFDNFLKNFKKPSPETIELFDEYLVITN